MNIVRETGSLLSSMVILGASLFFVYFIFFDVHGEQLKADIAYLRNTNTQTYPHMANIDQRNPSFATASFIGRQTPKKEI